MPRPRMVPGNRPTGCYAWLGFKFCARHWLDMVKTPDEEAADVVLFPASDEARFIIAADPRADEGVMELR